MTNISVEELQQHIKDETIDSLKLGIFRQPSPYEETRYRMFRDAVRCLLAMTGRQVEDALKPIRECQFERTNFRSELIEVENNDLFISHFVSNYIDYPFMFKFYFDFLATPVGQKYIKQRDSLELRHHIQDFESLVHPIK